MKRTSSMVYRETAEADELYMVAVNTAEIYEGAITPVIANLQKKYRKGVYDIEKAVDAYYHVATLASQHYVKEFGYGFSVQDRFTTAVKLEERFREDV